LGFGAFEFVSSFDIRISDFRLLAAAELPTKLFETAGLEVTMCPWVLLWTNMAITGYIRRI
jgi:hypothetical protein